MSVSSIVPIQPRMWRGYDDPGLPVGAYIAHAVTLGDMSGGTNILEFSFKLAGEPISGRFYNIEQLNAFITQDISQDGSLQALNFERVATFMVGQRVWRLPMAGDGVTSASFFTYGASVEFPLFLGQTSRVVAEGSSVRMVTDNVNVQAYSGLIQGFIWEPRSVMAEGGLRRPLDSIYG